MDFWASAKILLSRWYVVVPALLATVGAAFGVTAAVSPSYEATGVVVLLVPSQPASPAPANGSTSPPSAEANPYLSFGAALDTTAAVVTTVMTSEETVNNLARRGATAQYEVGTGSEGGSPIISVIAQGSSKQEAIRTVTTVMASIRSELDRRQYVAGAPRNTWIRPDVVTAPKDARRLLGSRIRAIAAVGILGIAGSISLAFMAESIAEGRRQQALIERERESEVDVLRGPRRTAEDGRHDLDSDPAAVGWYPGSG